MTPDSTLDQVFVDFACRKLEQLAGRIGTCLDKLTVDQIWLRGAESENAVGNLVLHLCGNVRQWIGAGAGGKPDIRVRDREFAARGGIQPAELRERLASTVAEAVAVLRGLDEAALLRQIEVQNYKGTVAEAVFHVVEHFGQHAGQIFYATKHFTGEDLGFYRHLSRTAHGEKTP